MKSIDEMMENYQVNEDILDLNSTLEEDEKERILKITLKKLNITETEVERKKGSSRKRIAILALAATLCFGTVFAFATGIFQMSDSMKKFFNMDSNEEVNSHIAGTIIDKQVTKDGWTLDLKEVIGDSKNIYVLYDVIAPKGTVLGDNQYMFRTQMMNVVEGMSSGGWNSIDLEDDDLTDNKKSYMFCGNASAGVKGKTVKLTLGDYSMYNPDIQDFEKVQNGELSATFPLNFDVSSQKIDIGKSVEICEGESTLERIEISPISAIVTFKGESIAKSDETPPPVGYDVSQDINFSIVMKDGTVFDAPIVGASSTEKDQLIFIQNYSKLIDIDNIKEFKVCGITVPMK